MLFVDMWVGNLMLGHLWYTVQPCDCQLDITLMSSHLLLACYENPFPASLLVIPGNFLSCLMSGEMYVIYMGSNSPSLLRPHAYICHST